MKFISRKFILTLIALVGSLCFMFVSTMDGMSMAAVIGAVAALVGQYSASNAFGSDKHD